MEINSLKFLLEAKFSNDSLLNARTTSLITFMHFNWDFFQQKFFQKIKQTKYFH